MVESFLRTAYLGNRCSVQLSYRAFILNRLQTLFVDEAGQMSLSDVVAISQAAKCVVLLGDPRQLEQPLHGTHPPGLEVSALQPILGTHETMPANQGCFCTWRLSPAICEFTSESFYEGRLKSHDGLDRQKLIGGTRFADGGLWFVPVAHEGNQSTSPEEVNVVAEIVNELFAKAYWFDKNNETHRITIQDILIVWPYTAHVFQLAERLPNARVGAVDKFQGQEAPVVIYSMATSTPEEAPHGMEFLYGSNRFNVATSRARCACIPVASPRLFEPECKTPHQMTLANSFCRYLEMARRI